MKVEIDKTTYLFLLFSFLSGYFVYMYLLLIIIFVHECGHYFFAKLLNFNYKKIIIYPFGGITKYNEKLNINTNKELFILFGGIIFQVLFMILIKYLYINGFVIYSIYDSFIKINIILIKFNFLPIIPLDGGRLVNVILDKFLSYYNSFVITLLISIISLIVFIIFNHELFDVLLFLFLIKELYFEYKNINFRFNKFLLERYLCKYNFKKVLKVDSIKKIRRDYYHIINNKFEDSILYNLFDRKI